MSKIAYSYIRFSTAVQATGDSLRRQSAGAEAYAAEHGLTLDSSLRDLGVSAFSGANRTTGALGRFKLAVERGEVRPGSVLIVESLDRLSREDVLSAMEGLLGLIRAGIEIVTLLDGQSYSQESVGQDWTRLMLSVVLMARAHEESATKSVRIAKAWGAKRDRATASGRAMTGRCVAWVRVVGDIREDAHYELIPERVAVLREIYELTAAGFGQRQVCGRLNRDGVPVWGRGNGWHTSYVSKILESRAVLGFYQPHVKPRKDVARTPIGQEIAGYYPAAIDENLYYRALAARAERKLGPGGRKGPGVSNILAGLGKCDSCGRVMVHLDKGKLPKGGRYLYCDSIARGLECAAPARWRYEKAEAAVLSGVRRLDVSAILGQSAADDGAARVRALASQLEAATRRRDRMLDALGDLDDSAIVARLRSAADEVARLTAEHEAAVKAVKVDEHRGGLPDQIAAVSELADLMTTTTGDDLAALRTRLAQELKRVLIRLRFTPDNILADYRPPSTGKRSAFEWLRGVPLVVTPAALAELEADHAAREREAAAGGPWPGDAVRKARGQAIRAKMEAAR